MKIKLLFAFLLTSIIGYSQDNCATAEPFCDDFGSPATVVNGSNAEAGPDYGCLITQPNPSWSILKIESAGDINLRISQETNTGAGIDVDYICYGPFNDPVSPCVNGELTAANTVACSYSSAAVEFLNIINAQVGEYYLILITNYSGALGTLTFEQTNTNDPTAGVSDCSIVCTIETIADTTLCINNNITLTTTLGNDNIALTAQYKWFKNNVEIVGEVNDELIVSSNTVTTDVYKVTLNSTNCDDESFDEVTITYVDVFASFLQTPIPSIKLCDNNNDGFATFNLLDNENTIANLENTNDYTFTYFTDAGLLNQIATPNSFTNTTANIQTVFVRATHNSFLGCNGIFQFDIEVYNTPIANPVSDWYECDDDTDGFLFWDFSTLNNTILGSQNSSDYTITYHNTVGDANNNVNPLPTVYNNTIPNELKTIAVRIENNLFIDCFNTTTFLLKVIENPIITTPNNWLVCDVDADGFNTFNLTSLNTDILNGQNATELSITYHKNIIDANTNSNPFLANYTNDIAYAEETIFIRLESTLNSSCVAVDSFNIDVFDAPVANTIDNWYECDDDLDGFLPWDLASLIPTVLGSQNPLDFDITFHLNQADATNNNAPINVNYTNLASYIEEPIFVRIENVDNIDCFDTTTFNIRVIETAIAYPIQDWFVCDAVDNDGFFEFDFVSEINPQIINNQNVANSVVTYFLTQQFADDNINAIDLNYTNVTAFTEETIFVRIENVLLPECYNTTTFNLKVNKVPVFDVEDTKYICVNLLPQTVIFEVENPLDNYTYSWKDALGNELSTSSVLNAIVNGDYTITATTTDSTMCETTKTVHLLPAEPATIVDFTINEYWEAENFSLELIVEGTGVYQYAIDDIDGPYQDEPYFVNIKPGIHTVYVQEMNDCGLISKEIDLFGFAAYFSPNDDGAHDVWKVQGINFSSTAKIYIFDRFGKIMAQFSPANNEGWDGYYNGKQAPEGEYWFTAQMLDYKGEPIIRKGHFSLKRTNN